MSRDAHADWNRQIAVCAARHLRHRDDRGAGTKQNAAARHHGGAGDSIGHAYLYRQFARQENLALKKYAQPP